MKVIIIVVACILAYIVVAFLNYGYVKIRRNGSEDFATFSAIGWPLYWVGRGFSACAEAAENVWTEPPPPPPPKLERSR